MAALNDLLLLCRKTTEKISELQELCVQECSITGEEYSETMLEHVTSRQDEMTSRVLALADKMELLGLDSKLCLRKSLTELEDDSALPHSFSEDNTTNTGTQSKSLGGTDDTESINISGPQSEPLRGTADDEFSIMAEREIVDLVSLINLKDVPTEHDVSAKADSMVANTILDAEVDLFRGPFNHGAQTWQFEIDDSEIETPTANRNLPSPSFSKVNRSQPKKVFGKVGFKFNMRSILTKSKGIIPKKQKKTLLRETRKLNKVADLNNPKSIQGNPAGESKPSDELENEIEKMLGEFFDSSFNAQVG